FLQIGTDARLLQQQGFRLPRQIVEQALNRDQVRYRLGQGARQLLQLAEAVEFERVECGVAGLVLFTLIARQDLRFRFELELAQAADRLLEFDEVEAERRYLLLETRTVDRYLAGVVDQRVEKVGAHADHFLRRACLRLFLFDRRQVARRAHGRLRRRGSGRRGN